MGLGCSSETSDARRGSHSRQGKGSPPSAAVGSAAGAEVGEKVSAESKVERGSVGGGREKVVKCLLRTMMQCDC